jgi:hypothetical protein
MRFVKMKNINALSLKLRRVLVAIPALIGIFGVAHSAEAADRYVRQGAAGNGSGSDWANACNGFTGVCAVASLVRGDTYYVADGSYGSLTLNRAAAGTLLITIKKATVAQHGTNAGWDNTFGDGQAIFGGLIFITDYWKIDGVTRNESAWDNAASYGFRATEVVSNRLSFGSCADNVTLQFVDVNAGFSGSGSSPTRPLYLGGFGGGSLACANWVISRNYFHQGGELQLAGTLNTLIEHNFIGPIWSKEIIRGQVSTVNTTIRHNVLYNGCRDDNNPGTGCTAEVAFFGNQGDIPDFEGVFVYGNVVRKTLRQHKTDATFWFQSNNCKIYNNTVYDDATSGQGRFVCSGGSGSEIRNNITYFPGGLGSGCGASVCDNNSFFTSSAPFVNLSLGDFRLVSALPGVALATQYQLDRNGVTRGSDGVWDRGALEFGGSVIQPPSAPSNLHITTP